MNQIVIAPEVLMDDLAADTCYAEILAARIAAADRGEFASEAEVARFFSELGE